MKTPRQRIEEVMLGMVGSEPLKPTMWLRNTYGLGDDDTLNAGEIEELLESYDADIRYRIPEAAGEIVGIVKKVIGKHNANILNHFQEQGTADMPFVAYDERICLIPAIDLAMKDDIIRGLDNNK